MKLRKIDVDVKMTFEDGTESAIQVSDSYQEPESLREVSELNIPDADKLRAFQYGLYNINAGRVRSAHNYGNLAKKLVDSKVFGSTKEAFEFILSKTRS